MVQAMLRHRPAILLFVISVSLCTGLLMERKSDTLETETGEIGALVQQKSEESSSLSSFHLVSSWKHLQNARREGTPQTATQLSLPAYLHLRRTKRAHEEGYRSKPALSRHKLDLVLKGRRRVRDGFGESEKLQRSRMRRSARRPLANGGGKAASGLAPLKRIAGDVVSNALDPFLQSIFPRINSKRPKTALERLAALGRDMILREWVPGIITVLANHIKTLQKEKSEG